MVERFVGLDVSGRSTSVCILDGQGNRIWRGKCATDPAVVAGVIRARGRRSGTHLPIGDALAFIAAEPEFWITEKIAPAHRA